MGTQPTSANKMPPCASPALPFSVMLNPPSECLLDFESAFGGRWEEAEVLKVVRKVLIVLPPPQHTHARTHNASVLVRYK